MLTHFLRLICSLVILCCALETFAQTPSSQNRSSRGREFFLTFMPNVHDVGSNGTLADSLSIYITCDVATSGVITYRNRAGREFTQPFQITNPAQVYIFRLNYSDFEVQGFYLGQRNGNDYDFANAQSERIARQSFRITANNDVTVYALNQAWYTSDACLVLPKTALGTSYMVLAYKSDANGPNFDQSRAGESSTPSQFAVVATENNTDVVIRPSAATSVARTTAQQTVRLNQGDVYLVQADPRAGNGFEDLTGSRITANRPIAVFAGHQRTTLPAELRLTVLRTRDHLIEQLPGLETWGKSAFLTPFPRAQGEVSEGNDLFRVLAAYDSTRVFFNGQFVRTLRSGEYIEENLINPGLITASDQILVAQYKKTSSPTDGSSFRGDPFMLIIPTIEQYDNSYRIVNVQAFDTRNQATVPGGQVFDAHYVTLVAPNSTLDNIRFDENLVGRGRFLAIPNTQYSYANISTSPGTHTARADSAFAIYVYGYGILNSYGYIGGGKLKIIAPDRDEPFIAARDTCFGVRGTVYDTLLTDSRIASVQIENARNMAVIVESFRPFADSVRFSATLQNNLLDGGFTLIARDSAGFISRRTFTVRGMTVAVEGQGATPQVPEQRFTIDVGRSRTFRIPIVNYGTSTQTITTIQIANDQQSSQLRLLTPSFPLTLAPNQRDTVVLAFQTQQTGTFSANVIFGTSCLNRTISRVVIAAGIDTAAPTVSSTTDNCARTVSLRLTDSEPFPSGIRAVQPIGQLVNCTLQIEPITNSLDVRARLSILNPRRDAIYALQIIDSAGNERIIRETVQGFTIELQRGSGETPAPGAFGAVEITKRDCRTLTYRNVGVLPFVINRTTPRSNIWFSLPESQFPVVIPPSETRTLTVCFAPLIRQQHRDTLILEAFCVQDVLPLTGEGTSLVRLNSSRCAVDIRLTTDSAPLQYFMEQNFPNPASAQTAIVFGLTAESPVKLTLYTSLGVVADVPLQTTFPKGTHEISLDVSALESGVYFYELQTAEGRTVRQLYVVR